MIAVLLCLAGASFAWRRRKRRYQVSKDADLIALALDYARMSQDEGAQAWAIDQMVRVLTGPGYDAWVNEYCAGENGPDTYQWNDGATR